MLICFHFFCGQCDYFNSSDCFIINGDAVSSNFLFSREIIDPLIFLWHKNFEDFNFNVGECVTGSCHLEVFK